MANKPVIGAAAAAVPVPKPKARAASPSPVFGAAAIGVGSPGSHPVNAVPKATPKPAAKPATKAATPTADTRGPASDILTKMLAQWGIDTSSMAAGSIGALVDKYVKDGTFNSSTTGDVVQLYLQDTPEWQRRFSGNAARVKAGMAALSPAEYLAAESGYQQVLQAAGLPKGFYDDPSDFSNFIANGVSASEVNDRAQAAVTAAQNVDPAFKNMLSQYGYPLDNGQLAAYMLDPTRALPTIQRQISASQIGAAGNRQGAGLGTTDAEKLLDMGKSADQVGTAYSNVNSVLPDAQRLAHVYGDSYAKGDATNEFLFEDAQAAKKRLGLAGKEKASFSGSGAAAGGSLAQGTGGY